MSTDYDTISLHSETDRKQLKGFIEESVLHKRKIKLENEALADIKSEVKSKLKIDPTTFNQLVKARLDDSFDKVRQAHEDFDTVVELLYSDE